MKTGIAQVWMSALVLALAALSARSQDVFVSGAPGSVNYYAIAPLQPAAPAPACQQPRRCLVPVPCAVAAPVCQPIPQSYCPPVSPSVIYIGSYRPCRSYSSCGNSSVIYFGRGQACQQGYLFGLRR